jgi:protein-S-isoprenylcysteine O-methyltransferase Ste14
MNLSGWALVALVYHLASRLAYVLYVGIALKRQEQRGYLTRRHGVEAGFRRFRLVASILMYSDGVSFVALCVASWNTLRVELPGGLIVAAGAVLVLVGLVTKVWAAVTLGGKAYYWYNFFDASERVVPNTTGPYRFLRNPMYTVGYLQIYGLALVTRSLPGLVAALVDQAAILAFYRLVEKPHFDRSSAASSLDREGAAAQNTDLST